MSLTDIERPVCEKEKHMLHNWAKLTQVVPTGWPQPKESSSYQVWQGVGAHTYGWDSLLELRSQLEDALQTLPHSDEAALICATAAYKLRHVMKKNVEGQGAAVENIGLAVPDYIYIF